MKSARRAGGLQYGTPKGNFTIDSARPTRQNIPCPFLSHHPTKEQRQTRDPIVGNPESSGDRIPLRWP